MVAFLYVLKASQTLQWVRKKSPYLCIDGHCREDTRVGREAYLGAMLDNGVRQYREEDVDVARGVHSELRSKFPNEAAIAKKGRCLPDDTQLR